MNKTLSEHRACQFLTAVVIVPYDSNRCILSELGKNKQRYNKDHQNFSLNGAYNLDIFVVRVTN